MSWYVFALVDAVPAGRLGRGLTAALRARPIAGAYAIVERRADVPPAELGSLRAHQAIVSRLAKAVPAILPVRFGTLLDADALDQALEERDEEIAEALALVRHRVQFTWRRARPASAATRRRRMSGSDDHGSPGTAYLRRAARDAAPAPPAAFRPLRRRLQAFVVRELFEPAANGRPDTLYQLVEKTAVPRYRVTADALTLANDVATVSGPWPPFAFAPEVV